MAARDNRETTLCLGRGVDDLAFGVDFFAFFAAFVEFRFARFRVVVVFVVLPVLVVEDLVFGIESSSDDELLSVMVCCSRVGVVGIVGILNKQRDEERMGDRTRHPFVWGVEEPLRRRTGRTAKVRS